MRVKKGFINRNVCGESVLLATGQENIDFTNIISLNDLPQRTEDDGPHGRLEMEGV